MAAGQGEILCREGDDLSQQTVFGKVNDFCALALFVPEEGGGGQGHHAQQGEEKQENKPSAGGDI